MSRNRKSAKTIQKLYKIISGSIAKLKKLLLLLLRTFVATKRKPRSANAGFVLPTVAMVSIVVVLLTVAIMFRSFERSKNASNVRVNETVLKAATPAIDRAKAKITELLNDPELPRTTPTDISLNTALTKDIGGGKTKLDKYTFGDETQLDIRYDINGDGSVNINPTGNLDLEDQEVVKTAWRYPVDTDNNGKFDSYTIYGIFFRSPSRQENLSAGQTPKFDRARSPLEARNPPMDDGNLTGLCAAAKGTSASLIGQSGWYKAGSNIKKSFFVYTTTVPITDNVSDTSKFETYKGNKGFSAIEYQQDQERTPLASYAVVYEDDLEITPGAGLRLNGGMFTNSNLQVARTGDPIQFYQVSSPKSCFYEAQTSKVLVGGNVGNGRITGQGEGQGVPFDLFRPGVQGGSASVDGDNKSVNNTAAQIAYNSQAFAQRISTLVAAQTGANPADDSRDPRAVREAIAARLKNDPDLDRAEVRREELEVYFKQRTMKVPFARVPLGQDATTDFTGLQDSGTDKLRGPEPWIDPLNQANTGLRLLTNRLRATEPNKLKEANKEEEKFLGDRILVGNNLPALWFDKDIQDFVGRKVAKKVEPQTDWDDWSEEKYRYRTRSTQIQQLLSLDGATKRDGLFEEEASKAPKNILDNVGGMRVVTGAGVYIDDDGRGGAAYPRDNANPNSSALPTPYFPLSVLPASRTPNWDTNLVDPNPTSTTDDNRVKISSLRFQGNDPIVIWPDSMPMEGGAGVAATKGDLLMRATAVYHYRDNAGKDQTPMACVSSYYDPTNATTARNAPGLPTAYVTGFPYAPAPGGRSNNGVVYNSYSGSRLSAVAANLATLRRQARLVFPNGRFANEPLRNAVEQYDRDATKLSMADNSAFDTAICAIQILNGTLAPNPVQMAHGTIYETAFLDSRQVKSNEQEVNVARLPLATDLPQPFRYTRSIEERQPLEVRVTVLDLNVLRQRTIGGSNEYLLPNSGIIYATRDDALPDLSDTPNIRTIAGVRETDRQATDRRKLISPTDYKLDPTRRPNGIMLINGSRLDRQTRFREEEKGLILATNVPAYIRGDFNLHARGGNANQPVEEFTELLRDGDNRIDWSRFYNRTNLDNNFACRPGDPRLPSSSCTTGDTWRPATVLADSVTIISDNFRYGFRNEGDYDLNNNGVTNVVIDPSVNGYDFNGNGNATDTLDETSTFIGFDLNGDGDATDTAVSEANQISSVAVRRHLGFLDNNYVTSSNWYDENTATNPTLRGRGAIARNPVDPRNFGTTTAYQGSSYVNNFVTPIQRRVQFGEYVMEICTKLPVTTCTAPDDWVVIVGGNRRRVGELSVATPTNPGTDATTLDSGTTARLANADNQRFARRVAFLRDPSQNNRLVLDSNGYPIPLGVNSSGRVTYYPYNNVTLPFSATTNSFSSAATGTTPQSFLAFNNTSTLPFSSANPNRPQPQTNALWFRTADDTNFPSGRNGQVTSTNYGKAHPLFYLGRLANTAPPVAPPAGTAYSLGTNQHPLLVPVLSIYMPFDDWTNAGQDPSDNRPDLLGELNRGSARNVRVNWLQTAIQTTTNLIIAGGDTPSRPNEYNGGLENFVRYLERWRGANDVDIPHAISGSLIQYKRSQYATAPWDTIQVDGGGNPRNQSFYREFGGFYQINVNEFNGNNRGKTPFYSPPSRQWGFDVGLLSQIPDLFAQQFTLPPTADPNEFFREISRDDDWVKTLLCAKVAGSTNNAVSEKDRPRDFCIKKTGG